MSLALGSPDNTMLARTAHLLQKATHYKIVKDMEEHNYDSYDYIDEGDPYFLGKLANYLSDEYGSQVRRCDLFPTCGSTHALHLVPSFLATPVVFVEDPTYFNAIDLLRSFGCEVVSVPCDDDGIIPVELDHLVQQYYPAGFKPTKSRPYRAMTYLVPVFNNPRGHIYPTDRCKELISVARKYDLLLFCDDVYNLYYYETEFAPPRMFSMDDKCDVGYKGSVVSCGSFSKMLAPSLRCGWIEAPAQVVEIVSAVGNLSQYTSSVLASAFELGLLQATVKLNRSSSAIKMNETLSLLAKLLPREVTFTKPKGGFFIWLRLPSELAVEQLKSLATEFSIDVMHGAVFSVDGISDCVRLSIASLEKDDLMNHVTAFCDCVNKLMRVSSESIEQTAS